MVKNRDRWTVEVVHRDRSLSVAGRTGRVRLPAAYLASHVELAYAETSHANQGRTVDRSLLYLDGPTGASGATPRLPRVGSPGRLRGGPQRSGGAWPAPGTSQTPSGSGLPA